MGLSDADLKRVAQLVDALDHPDAVHQREIMDVLVSLGADVLDPLEASLGLVTPRVKTALVRVMGELGDRRALLPLMRFVFDNGDDPAVNDARALAMKAVAHIAGPEDAGRVFAFLLDVHHDPDPFVRGYAYAAMGRFGDKRAVPFLKEALKASDEFVREQATRALAEVEGAEGDSLETDVSDIELLRQLRGAKGGEREYWINELLGRDSAFEMTRGLVEEGGRGASLGLQLMQRIDDPRVRAVALRKAQGTSDPDQLAIALRIVASKIEGDATEDERAQAKLALYNEDRFVRLAALGIAGASGDRELMERAVAAAADPDPIIASTAAEALARGTGPEHRRFLPELIDAARSSLRSRDGDTEEAVRARAYLLRAIRNVVSAGGFGVSDAQEIALELLAVEDARPIVVTGLELLEVTTRHGATLDGSRVVNFAELLRREDPSIRSRAFEVLERAVPAGADALLGPLERLLYDADPSEAERAIRVVERVGTSRARALVERVARESGGEMKVAAEAALRRLRSGDDFIDATFESSSDSDGAGADGEVPGTRSDEPDEPAEKGPDDPATGWGEDSW